MQGDKGLASLICRLTDIPDINWQFKVFNGGIQPDPIFSVFYRFQYKKNINFLFDL
jgi:hypothetical protein